MASPTSSEWVVRPDESGAARVCGDIGRRMWVVYALVLTATGCEGRHDYRDAPDLSAVRKAFGCSSVAEARFREACDVIAAFERATAVSFSSDVKFYVGDRICSTEPTHAALFRYELEAEAAPVSPKVDSTHTPRGQIRESIVSFNPRFTPLAMRTLRALAEGDPSPRVAPEGDGVVPQSWNEWRSDMFSPGAGVPHLAVSNGVSLLSPPGYIPAMWDDASPSVPYSYFRMAGRELYSIRPPTGSGKLGHESCLTRAYQIPE
ncbi:MAG: hypothetical protein AAF735_01305 [Myxococcota bacterium]